MMRFLSARLDPLGNLFVLSQILTIKKTLYVECLFYGLKYCDSFFPNSPEKQIFLESKANSKHYLVIIGLGLDLVSS